MPFKDYDFHKQYNREARNQKYKDDPEYRAKRIAAAAQRRAEISAWVNAQKTPCVRCGEADRVCLDFHHVDPSTKEFTIREQGRSMSRQRLEAELKKCIVLCANCHRREHHNMSH